MSAEQTVAAASAELDGYCRWLRRVWRRVLVLTTQCESCRTTTNETINGVCLPCQYGAYADRPGPDCPQGNAE